ncbi:putative disease resistance protein RGA3 isoform X1 [Vigna radiata var. radiata]|uniref:Disease resistance protein RGA3 isoform X1 n=2 Tax=Vigna radiata var. radiata TaxID=3916 RepID=A0A1S3TNS8_VIGRR|nr:putative disease resistance protein RGA3 isoform X1 [Vigna radiata var. radiata]
MAECFVFDITESLLSKLASYVYEEASRAYGVYDDLRGIKDTLSIVKGVLLDAEEKKEQNHGVREWLRQIRNVCFDAEDVLDGLDCQNLRKQALKASGNTRMKVDHFFSSFNSLVFRFRMAHQIKHVRRRLDKIAADGNKFGLERIDVDNRLVQRREMTYSHVDASGVIGRESDREKIIKLLMQHHPNGDGYGDQSICVIPIVGIGGLGKTTLAKLVFNDKRMDDLFQLKMWVCISDDFDIRQILIKIINSASASAPTIALAHQENIKNFDIEQLQSRLRHRLSGQKYLLVLDDVWNDNRPKWTQLKDLIKVGAVGSKILVTTRSNSIASMMGTVPSYALEGLSLENCYALFNKWAFKEGEEKKYSNLVEIGKEIVKKCIGVPLAVRTLGSSLFLNFNLERWEFVRDHGIWNLKQEKDDILPALKLSYDQMPSYLRHCFAFFSLYPKDYGFTGAKVVNLWVSLGLLRSEVGSQKLENAARLYIDELHSRSFLEDFEDFGNIYYFKVHDLVHDLAQYVAKEEILVVDSGTRNIPEQVRHLSVVENSLRDALFPKSSRVRTILFPTDGVGVDSVALLDAWIARYKFLRILDLSDSSFETFPNSIAKLEHLRALSLENNRRIKRLPQSICKLQNLQVLTLRGCVELETLPKGFGMLISLRQLSITTKQSILSEDEFASLINLNTLSFEFCDNLMFLFRGTQQLKSLEVLIVQSCRSLESFPFHILPKLEVLFVIRCEMLNLSLNCENPIERLRMKFLHIEECPRQQTLPQWIEGAAETLQTLLISNLHSLEMLPEWLTSMTHLKMLHIVNCPQLLYLPSDMHRLGALEDLTIDGCSELCQKCEPQSGEYWSFIAHIKHLSIGETREGKLLFQMQKQIRLKLQDLQN